MTDFSINGSLDADDLAEQFARSRRLRIASFLSPGAAERLTRALVESARWRFVLNLGEKLFESDRAAFDAMPSAQRVVLDAAINNAATTGFQFRYETFRVSDDPVERVRSGTILDAFAQFMSAPSTLNFFRCITGVEDLAFADAQATRYCPGDFLTRHDDNVDGKHRRLAYVLGLSKGWRAEWGGLLSFNNDDGDVVETILQRFNALSLFAVPQPHSVSLVAPYAGVPRLAVTGWIRTRLPGS